MGILDEQDKHDWPLTVLMRRFNMIIEINLGRFLNMGVKIIQPKLLIQMNIF